MSLVAIVGRPNVGKSTLFNRLTESRKAIVSDESGTTRDRQYGKVEWGKKEFSVVDTGGFVTGSDDIFEGEINKQVRVVIEEADVILFMVDVQSGVTDLDADVAKVLRGCKKPVLLVVNKADNNELLYQSAEFYSLGLGDPICVSSMTGSGTGDLLDAIVPLLTERTSDDAFDESLPRIAVVGRPNAGKSSIINAYIGEERNIVTDIAGTTRDSIYTKYDKFGKSFYLVDTAGIRKKAKVNEDLEFYSVMRSIRAIENSDVCVLMLDATRGVEGQDQNIFSLIQRNSKGLVVCVNKWDLVEERTSKAVKTMEEAIRNRFAPGPAGISAGAENRRRRIPTNKLNEFFLPLIENYPPPALKGKYIKIKYVMQIPETKTPTFLFFANLPQYIKDPYKRFLENKLRDMWDLTGTPVQLFFRDKSPDRK